MGLSLKDKATLSVGEVLQFVSGASHITSVSPPFGNKQGVRISEQRDRPEQAPKSHLSHEKGGGKLCLCLSLSLVAANEQCPDIFSSGGNHFYPAKWIGRLSTVVSAL